MTPAGERTWTEAEIARLRVLHARPELSYAEIGRLLKRTKCSITSAANRMGLPARPSPVKARPAGYVAPTAAQAARKLAGAEQLSAFHPIAAAVLREARWPE